MCRPVADEGVGLRPQRRGGGAHGEDPHGATEPAQRPMRCPGRGCASRWTRSAEMGRPRRRGRRPAPWGAGHVVVLSTRVLPFIVRFTRGRRQATAQMAPPQALSVAVIDVVLVLCDSREWSMSTLAWPSAATRVDRAAVGPGDRGARVDGDLVVVRRADRGTSRPRRRCRCGAGLDPVADQVDAVQADLAPAQDVDAAALRRRPRRRGCGRGSRRGAGGDPGRRRCHLRLAPARARVVVDVDVGEHDVAELVDEAATLAEERPLAGGVAGDRAALHPGRRRTRSPSRRRSLVGRSWCGCRRSRRR